jgi:hypothetical protein
MAFSDNRAHEPRQRAGETLKIKWLGKVGRKAHAFSLLDVFRSAEASESEAVYSFEFL